MKRSKYFFLRHLTVLFLPILAACFLTTKPVRAESAVIDFIVASVDGKPITLSDVSLRANVPPPSTPVEASRNPAIQSALQQMIIEYLLKAEAKARRLDASKEEIDRYIDRVAAQNQLTREEFVVALSSEGRDLTQYKQQIEIDILRTKLANSLMRDGVSISDKEVDTYLEENETENISGGKVKLRQIVLDKSGISREEALSKLNEIKDSVDSVSDFSSAAVEYSEGGEASEGGLIGVLTEEELSGDIFDALYNLPEESTSEVVETARGYHLFYVEKRYSSDDDDDDEPSDEYRDEVRENLKKRKLEERMNVYFAQELFEKYAVDKKI